MLLKNNYKSKMHLNCFYIQMHFLCVGKNRIFPEVNNLKKLSTEILIYVHFDK